MAPRLPRIPPVPTPDALRPFEERLLPRPGGGHVAATWYPAPDPRGAVLLAPPWLEWGRAYFHRRGRIEALREAGYAALAFDLGGFGGSTPTRGFRDRDAALAFAQLERLAPGLPRHVWGVSSGGHWLHPLLATTDGAHGAFFEDVTPHLLEWSAHTNAAWRPLLAAVRAGFPRTDRYMDMRNHAPHLRARKVAYVAGGSDRGIPEADARALATLARGTVDVVPGAGHLQAIKQENAFVLAKALATFKAAAP